MKHILFFLFTLTGLVISAHAQQKLLQGQIRDKQTGELLPNATISFRGPKGVNVVSGLNGTYSARSLPIGDYTIKVYYVGYKPFEGTYTVTAQQQQTFSITLEPNKNDLTEVIVAGKHDIGSDASALLAGRRADLIQNAVSSKPIEISPDLTVANVTQRVSGISLERSTNGEGDRKSV